MDIPHEAVLLRIFLGADDRSGFEPLYQAMVMKAREMGLAGATALRGPLGFGQSQTLHHAHILPFGEDCPIVLEIVDSEDKINAFLPILETMIDSGLVTLEKVRVIQYGRKRPSYLERLLQTWLHPDAVPAQPSVD